MSRAQRERKDLASLAGELEVAEAAFALGDAAGLDVLDAQVASEQAAATHIREELSADLARLSLQRALGGLHAAPSPTTE